MGLLTAGEIYSLSGYVHHVCQLLDISYFNAGSLVFCDGRTKHELTRDTEYSVVLQDTHSTGLHDAEFYTNRVDTVHVCTVLTLVMVLL